jgi:hemolysin D
MAGNQAIAQAALEFQPDAAELEQRKLPWATRSTLYVLAAALVAGIAWASLSSIDRVVTSRGKLVTTASTMVVQPLETSTVRTIEVKVGDIVRAGDTLATLDQTFSEADAGQLRDKVQSLGAQIARLDSEIADRVYRIDARGANDEERLQETIHLRRRAQYVARIEAFDQQVARARAGIETKRADREALNRRLVVLRELEGMRGTLFEKDLGSKILLLDARNNRLQLERDLQLQANEITELEHEVSRARAEREAFVQEWRQKAAEELVTARREHDGTVKQLEKATRRNAAFRLTAPADAIVLEIAQRSVGSVLKEAEPLLTLVPLDVPLEAEVMIEAKDIGHVAADAIVRVKLDAYPFQKHGTLDGRLRTISEDSFTDKDKQGREGLYRARVALGANALREVPQSFRLIPGMTVTAEIKAGERTVMSYFLYPLLRGLDESIREP